jgi:xanthine dehydrogenase accessory factor
MKEILPDVDRWLGEGKGVALASVVSTWGSAPRAPGSKMAVSSAGEMAGSVSAGCVEGAVVEEALAVLRSGRPKRLHYGVSDETAWDVGLACGGDIDLFLEPLSPMLAAAGPGGKSPYDLIRDAAGREMTAVRAVVIDGPEQDRATFLVATADAEPIGTIHPPLADLVGAEARSMLASGRPEVRTYRAGEQEFTVFFDVLSPAPRLVIVGGVHIAIDLTRLAKRMGYEVAIVDPRKAFATRQRFPEADRIIHEWPDAGLRSLGLTSGTAVAVLSHDPKLDDPALLVALRSPAFYVGALGSMRTQDLRRRRLIEAGLGESDLARLHGPIGLDLGGREPAEVALSILAEIVAVRSGRSDVLFSA